MKRTMPTSEEEEATPTTSSTTDTPVTSTTGGEASTSTITNATSTGPAGVVVVGGKKKQQKTKPTPASTTTTTTTTAVVENSIVCTHCQQARFSSRNKLFTHLKLCQVNRNPSNHTIISDEDYHQQHQAYIYVTGGRVRGKTLITAERFNCRTNCWELIDSMAEHRGSHGSAVVDKKLYVMGGGGLHSNLNSVECYDTLTNTWSIVSQMQTFRHALSVIATENNQDIYAIGGWMDGTICSVDNERYNVPANRWEKCANMITGRRLLGVTSYQGKIYTFGGNCGDKVWNSNVVEIYDIASDTWSTGKSIPIAGQCSAVTIADYIYVIIHGHYILRYDPRQDDYVQLTSDLPCKQWFCFDVTVINDRMYFHGGNEDGVWSNAFWKYDVFTNVWTQLPSMHKERRRCSAAVVVL